MQKTDILIVSELSRLGRSLMEVMTQNRHLVGLTQSIRLLYGFWPF